MQSLTRRATAAATAVTRRGRGGRLHFSTIITPAPAATLLNKVVICTGGGSGIGHGISTKMASAGASVVIADLNGDQARRTANALPLNHKQAPHHGVQCDVSSEESVISMFEQVWSTYTQLDVVVCNAGVQHICPAHELDFADWRRLLGVHLDGTFLCSREALRYWYKHAIAGKLLFIGSIHSKEASVYKAPYVSAKHGVLGLARTLAKEAGPHGIAVNVINPGFVLTPLVEKQIPDLARKNNMSEDEVKQRIFLSQTVDGQFTTIDDVARTALYFAESPTNALTGQSINVSHGWNMN